MIDENPSGASDLIIVDAYDPTLTPSMTKLFQRLVDLFHVCILQKDKLRPTEMLPPQRWESAEEALKGTEPRYKVEHILDPQTRNRIEEYSVNYEGSPHEDATWEPIQHLDSRKDLLRALRANRTRHRRRTRREA
ncbi:hypothetical protein Efla_006704 [Eimeria flavescens]